MHLGDEGVPSSQRELKAERLRQAAGAILASAHPTSAASIFSAGGVGAGAWLGLPHAPGHFLSDAQCRVAVRTRLNLDIPGHAGTCAHRRRDGTPCGAALDPKGVHARSCCFGGWRVRKHETVKHIVGAWLEEQGCQVEYEQIVPTATPGRPEARIDLVVYGPTLGAPALLDTTIASALSVEALRAGSPARPGVAAELAEQGKRRDYPNIAIVPIALEDHGRLGAPALAFFRRVAPAGLRERSLALRGLFQALGAGLQRVGADAVLTALPPPAG